MGSSYRKGRREASRAEARLPEPELVSVFVTTAVRISDGPGPGHKRMPPDEAGRLVRDRRACYGSQPPKGFEDGGVDTRGVARMMPR